MYKNNLVHQKVKMKYRKISQITTPMIMFSTITARWNRYNISATALKFHHGIVQTLPEQEQNDMWGRTRQ